MLNARPGITSNSPPITGDITLRTTLKGGKGTQRPMTADLVDRPPWYCGYSSRFPRGTPLQKMARYGPQGAMEMTMREDPHAIICQDWAPGFLKKPTGQDPYAPPLKGSPQLWPVEACYVTGSKLKEQQESPKAAKDTHLMRTMDRAESEVAMLKAKTEFKEKMQRTKFKNTMKSINQTRSREYDSLGRRQESRLDRVKNSQLRYWKGFTMICATDDHTHAERAAEKTNAREEMKWTELQALCNLMKSSTYRKPGFQDLESLHMSLLDKVEGTSVTDMQWNVTRNQFVSVVHSKTYGGAKPRNLHRLFSSFDQDLNDKMDIREFTAAMRLLWKPSEPVMTKLQAAFTLFEDEKDEHVTIPHVFSILSGCAFGIVETMGMQKAVYAAFDLQAGAHTNSKTLMSRDVYTRTLKNQANKLMARYEEQYLNRLPEFVRAEISRCK